MQIHLSLLERARADKSLREIHGHAYPMSESEVLAEIAKHRDRFNERRKNGRFYVYGAWSR